MKKYTQPTKINKQELSDEQPWWKLDKMSLLLILGLVLFNIGVFISPRIFDFIISFFWKTFDIRRWPLWFFIAPLLTGFFAWRWCYALDDWKDEFLADEDRLYAVLFMRMSAVITFDMWLFILMQTQGWFKHFSIPPQTMDQLWTIFTFRTHSFLFDTSSADSQWIYLLAMVRRNARKETGLNDDSIFSTVLHRFYFVAIHSIHVFH